MMAANHVQQWRWEDVNVADLEHDAQLLDGKPTRFRYGILALIFLVTSLNYADRSTFSIAGSAVWHDLGTSTVQTGFILSAFA